MIDTNKVLRELRNIATILNDERTPPCLEYGYRLADLVTTLDAALSAGAALPKDWDHTAERDIRAAATGTQAEKFIRSRGGDVIG